MTATGNHKLPFGNLPRLLMAWVSTEAVKTQSHELVLGRSLSEFMRALGVYDSSGRTQTRLRNQMKRLFGCSVSLIYEDEHGEAAVNSPIARRTELWWNERKPDQPVLWESKIELGWDFFNEIINHPVPLDMNTLTALKRSSLGLDLYLWLTYRTFALTCPLRLTWKQLYRQFGAHPAKASDKFTVRNFRTKCLRELKKIKLAWPGLNYTTAPGLLIPSPLDPCYSTFGSSSASKLGSTPRLRRLLAFAKCRVSGPLKSAPGASCGAFFPQDPVIQASFPRAFGITPPSILRAFGITPPSILRAFGITIQVEDK